MLRNICSGVSVFTIIITMEYYIMWGLGYDTHPIFSPGEFESLFFPTFHYIDLNFCSFAAFVIEMLQEDLLNEIKVRKADCK